MKLYEIAEAYSALAGAEDLEEQKKYLEMLEGEFEQKAENITYILKDYETDIQILRDEEKRLAAKRKSIEARRDRLKDYLYSNMKHTGLKKLKAGTFDLRIQKNPKAVVIYDESKLTGDFIKIKKEIDKQKIKQAIEAGELVEGAELVQGEGLRIK